SSCSSAPRRFSSRSWACGSGRGSARGSEREPSGWPVSPWRAWASFCSAKGCCADLLHEEGVHARRRCEVLVVLDEQRRVAAISPDGGLSGAGGDRSAGVALERAVVEIQ